MQRKKQESAEIQTGVLLKERVNQVNSWFPNMYECKEVTVFSENKSRQIIIAYKQFLYKYVIN